MNKDLNAYLATMPNTKSYRNLLESYLSPATTGGASAAAPLPSFPAVPANTSFMIGMPEVPKGAIKVKPSALTLSKDGRTLIQYVVELMDPMSKFYTRSYPVLFKDFLAMVVASSETKEATKRELRKRFPDLNKSARNIDTYSNILLDLFVYLDKTPEAESYKNQLYAMLHPSTNLERRVAKLKYVSRKGRRSSKRGTTRRTRRN